MAVQVIGWTVGAIIIGALLYPLLMMARERKWCRFVGISPHEYKEVRHPTLLSTRNPLKPVHTLLAASGVPESPINCSSFATQRAARFVQWPPLRAPAYLVFWLSIGPLATVCSRRQETPAALRGSSSMQTLRGGIPQSASMTSFAAVYGPASDDEGAGLLPPQGVDPLPRVNENGLAAGPSSGTNGRLT